MVTSAIFKLKTPVLALAAIAFVSLGTGGCSLFHHHQPKSSWKIVDVNDDSTFITDSPTRAGTITHDVNAGSGQQSKGSRQQQAQMEHDRQQYELYQQQMQNAPQPQYQPSQQEREQQQLQQQQQQLQQQQMQQQ